MTTPIYDETRELSIAEGFDPESHPKPDAPTKRQRHRAGKLTQQVWAAICANVDADTSALSMEDTQEISPVTG